jgi:hypothetical protein
MKTTLDLPDELVREIKIRAVNQRQKLKDAVVELLRKGLAVMAAEAPRPPAAKITTDTTTGLPVIECRQAPAPHEEPTPDRIAAILLAQEAARHQAAAR